MLKFAADYASGRSLYLTTTHFHPEHAFGAQVFGGKATFLINCAQTEDLKVKLVRPRPRRTGGATAGRGTGTQ